MIQSYDFPFALLPLQLWPGSKMDQSQAPRSAMAPRSRRRWRLAVLVATVTAAGIAAVVWLLPQRRGQEHLRAARAALEDRDFAAARSHLQRYLELSPQDANAIVDLARVSRRVGDLDEAAGLLDRADSLGAPRRRVELERMLLQAQAGYLRPLDTGLARVGYGPEEDRLIREALVVGYLQGNFLDKAYQVTGKWVADRPDDWQGHFWQGRVLESGLELGLAVDTYLRALELRPANLEVRRHVGELFLRRGRYEEAEPHFDHLLRADPHNAAARLGLARCQRALHPAATARATLQPLLEALPDYPGVSLLAGELSLDEDRAEEALGWLRRAAALAPHDRDVNQALARALRRLNRPDEARAYEEVAAATARDHKRMEEITREVTQRPGDAALRYEAGTILARQDQPAAAAHWLLSALALDPAHAPTRRALAEYLPRLGDPRLTAYCRRVLAEQGDNRLEGAEHE
jgi:tetratricopeptide (TPR) repeat protein